jgi:hypothetical protein
MKIMAAAVLLLALASAAKEAVCSGDVYVVGGLTRESALSPGSSTSGKIILRNTSDVPREVRVYQTDYTCHFDGTSVYGDPGSEARSNAAWVTFTPHQLVIPAGETASVYYKVEVPRQGKTEGTYWSMLMVEPLCAADSGSARADDGKSEIGIRTVLRYGVQIVTNIGDTGSRELRFANKRLLPREDGKTVLELDIENSGQRWLTPQVWADLYDEEGVLIGRFEGGRLRLYPGCSGRFDLDLSQVPKGRYKALIVADNGDDSVFGAECRLEIE